MSFKPEKIKKKVGILIQNRTRIRINHPGTLLRKKILENTGICEGTEAKVTLVASWRFLVDTTIHIGRRYIRIM